MQGQATCNRHRPLGCGRQDDARRGNRRLERGSQRLKVLALGAQSMQEDHKRVRAYDRFQDLLSKLHAGCIVATMVGSRMKHLRLHALVMGYIVLFLVLCAPSGAAQKTVFDPVRDLEGYAERSQGAWADAYALDVYADLRGAELTPAMVEDVRKRWLQERIQVDGVVKGEPFAAAAWLLDKRMNRHAALKRLAYTQDRSKPPFVLYVQRESGAPESATQATVALYAPWLLAAHDALKRAVLLPSGAKEAQGRGAVGVVLLANREQFESLRPDLGNDGASNTATWDRARRFVVGCDDEYNKKSDASRVRGIVRESVRALLDAYVTAPDGQLGDVWLEQGLVLRFSQCRSEGPATLASPSIRPDLLTRLAQEAQVRERRDALYLPLARLCGLADAQALERASLETAEARGVPAAQWDDAVLLAYAQAEAWAHFFFDAHNGKRASGYVRYAAGALRGERGVQALSKAMGGETPEALQAEWAAWLSAQWKAQAKAQDPKATEVDDPFAGLWATDASAAPVSSARKPEAGTTEVALDGTEALVRHAAAFACAVRGSFAQAKVAYADLVGAMQPEPWRSRAARDLARVEQALLWRSAYIATLAAPGSKLTVERNGKKHSLPVESFDEMTLRLGSNKLGLEELAWEAITPADWLKQTIKKGAAEDMPPVVRAWLAALAREPKWDRGLEKDISEEVLALKEDVFVWYPEMLASADAAVLLAELDALPAPEDRASAERTLRAIAGVLASRKLEFVAQREAELLARGRLCLQLAANELGPADTTRADVSLLPDGRVKVHWGFDKERQLDDIELETEVGQDQLTQRRNLVRLRPEPRASIENSALVLRGPGVWALPISLEAPYTIKVKLKVRDDLQKEVKETPYFGILHSIVGEQSWLLTDPFGGVIEIDQAAGFTREAGLSKTRTLLIDETTTIEISHEGVNMSCGSNGKWTSTLNLMRRRTGRVCLVAVGDYAMRVEDIEIEGKIDRSWYAQRRAVWIEREYERLKGAAK